MTRNLPPLNALKAFEAAARHESFTAAAAELNVTHAAVSRHIRELEGWLGAKLFVRTGRGVELTERAKSFVPDVTRGFELIAAATETISSRRRRRRQQLVVTVEPSFAALWLIPRLGRFTTAHPDIEVVLDSSNRLADFARGDADVGVRYGRGTWNNVASTLLTRTRITPVCSPQLRDRLGITSPAELPAALLLQEESRRYWMEWLEAAGVADRITPEGPTLGLHLTIPAAESGQGFSLADDVIAGDALVGGRLVKPFEIRIESYGYYFVHDAARKATRPMAAMLAWLTHEIGETLEAVARSARAPEAKRRPKS
ncbi:MAG: transcriptional regulator GcvA [Hyphomicrobium sp.]|uniref:transcriptional regulator GcvA n=1 Tax=Hyphomicrobium sp. TaxID=82 RepID=UPI003D0F383D